MPKLTKSIVDSLSCCGATPAILWDDSLSGFGVKALPSGAKKYIVKYRTSGGGRSAAQRWLTLGAHGQLTCDQARSMAQQALAAVARGEDPQGEKFNLRSAPTLRDVWAKFEADYLPRRKPQTRRDYESQWRDIIEPKLGKLAVAEIARSDVDRLHKNLSKTPYRANRVIALCSRLMTLAEAIEWRSQGTNPCRYIQKYAELPRSRYLGVSELERLGEALRVLTAAGDIQASATNALKLLLLTGARLNEILQAEWAWVDWERQLIALPNSKTGAKPIYLGDSAIALLRAQQHLFADQTGTFIFPGRSPGKHMVNLRKPWVRVCAQAGIEDVRLHDLRHTAASIAVGQGASLPIIGRLLGHSQAQTTLRYAHVDADPALLAANQIGAIVDKVFGES